LRFARQTELASADEIECANENQERNLQQTPLMLLRVLLRMLTLGGRTFAFKKGCQRAAFFVFNN
jgi:hypothetical protein